MIKSSHTSSLFHSKGLSLVNLGRERPKPGTKPDDCGTDKGIPHGVLSAAEQSSPKDFGASSGIAVPDTSVLSDDDPEVIDQGRTTSAPDTSVLLDDDPEIKDQGRTDDFESLIDINLIQVQDFSFVPSLDVLYKEQQILSMSESELKSTCDAISNPNTQNDPDVDRAQIDTGTCATVTGKKHILHHYRKFTDDFPCPIRLQPATEGSDATPTGFGYMYVEAPTEQGFIPV